MKCSLLSSRLDIVRIEIVGTAVKGHLRWRCMQTWGCSSHQRAMGWSWSATNPEGNIRYQYTKLLPSCSWAHTGSATPQTVIPTHFGWFRQALTTCGDVVSCELNWISFGMWGTDVDIVSRAGASNIKLSDSNLRRSCTGKSVQSCIRP